MRRPIMWLIIGSAVLSLGIGYSFIHTNWAARAKMVAARKAVLNLSNCVETYRIHHGEYPPSLEDLAQKQPGGEEPLVEEKNLTDPWGRSYNYDPGKPTSGMMRARIWSLGPNPEDPKNTIGN